MITRQTIISALAALRSNDFIRAASLGGSDANARADEKSDADLFLMVTPGSVEPAAGAVESALRELSPISIVYRLPVPTWHGFHQAFYQLRDAPEYLMIDWVIIEVGTPHPWLEVERHGTHRVLFDKDSLLRPAHVDRAAIARTIERRVAELRTKFALFRHMPPKQVERGLPADASHFYQSLVLRPLVDMLRMSHCPDRHDFGFRYLKDDLPPREYNAVCRFCYPAGPDDIARFTKEINAMMTDLLERWDARARV